MNRIINSVCRLSLRASQRSFTSLTMKKPTFSFNRVSTFPQMIPSPSLVSVRSMANHRHKKMIKKAKGFRGRANRIYSVAKRRVMKALQYSYRDRKVILSNFILFIS